MIELPYLLAIFIALAGACSSASQSLFIRMGTDKGEANHGVIVVILVNVVVLVPFVAVAYYPDYGLTSVSWLAFIAAGIAGTLLGRLCMYTSIDILGASRTAPIVSAQVIVATVLGIVLLGESVSLLHGLGIVLTVGGVAAIAWETSHENPDELPRRDLLLSLLIPFGAVIAYGWEPIFANIGFAQGTPSPVGLAVKTVAASLGFTLYLRWKGMIPDSNVMRSPSTRWFVLAGLANTLFLLCYYVALEMAPVSIVMPIIITNTLGVVLLSAVFMPERLEQVTWKLFAAATVVVGGVLTITVFG